MLSCGHDPAPAYGALSCVHARAATDAALKFLRFYTGDGVEHHDLCEQCARRAESGLALPVGVVCEPCDSCSAGAG